MIGGMKVRSVSLAFVSSVLFAALVANSGSVSATTSSATALSAAGYQALTAGDASKAVPLFTQSIESRELVPDALANVLLNRALAYQQLSEHGKAIDDYTAALNLDAMTSDLRARVLYNRGLAQQKAQHPALAIEDFTSALLINSSFSYAYLARANALRENGQYLFSISDYERALKYQHPDAAHVYYGEALAYQALKRPTEAKNLLQSAVKADGSFAPAQEMLKSLGDVAQLEDETADPILTASTSSSPNGQTDFVKQVMPKAVEPPAGLMAQDPSADANTAIADAGEELVPEAPSAKTIVANAKSVAPVAAEGSSVGLAEDAKVVVASIPKLPVGGKVKVAAAKVEVKPTAVVADTAAETTASTDAAPAVAIAGWAVQISSANSETAAWDLWRKMQKGHKVLAGKQAAVVKADLGAKGTFYRVRLGGYADQAAAQSACGKLKAGGIACFVAKANG